MKTGFDLVIGEANLKRGRRRENYISIFSILIDAKVTLFICLSRFHGQTALSIEMKFSMVIDTLILKEGQLVTARTGKHAGER